MAPPSDAPTERSLRLLKNKIMACLKNHKTNNTNHSGEDRQALDELRSKSDIIVKPSDKCKGFVIMSKDTYVEKADTITSQYEQVPRNPTPRLEATTKKVKSEKLGGKKKISDKIARATKPTCSRTAKLYGLLKCHKDNIPLRPIESTCGDPVDKLTWLLERIVSQAQLLAFVRHI